MCKYIYDEFCGRDVKVPNATFLCLLTVLVQFCTLFLLNGTSHCKEEQNQKKKKQITETTKQQQQKTWAFQYENTCFSFDCKCNLQSSQRS